MTQDLFFTQEGALGLITLNRPGALNALTLSMIQELQKQLILCKEDKTIKAVVIRAVPGSAFCAGGDVRWLYQLGPANAVEQMEFFWHEYRLNHFIHHFGKPYIALMDGITMGGGVGISLHGSHPVASERFVFAMPETSIGFFPDIGSSHLLVKCSHSLGIYLGLTGNRLGAEDALRVGLVRHVIPSDQMQQVLDALMHEDLSVDAHERVSRCLGAYAGPVANLALAQTPLIDKCFSQPTVEAILSSLENSHDEWADKVKNTLEQKSPFSLKLTLSQLQKAKGLSLAECLQMDFNLVNHFMRDKDFYEGVRALLIDKDKNPQWSPSRLDLVGEEKIINYFEPPTKKLEFLHS